MSLDAARRVADAVLYEGYLLYPYRASSPKNQVRWQFGVLSPVGAAEAGVGERSGLRTECLLRPGRAARVDVHVRFLQVQARTVEAAAGSGFTGVDELRVGDATWIPWQEGVEREVAVPALGVDDLLAGRTVPVAVDGGEDAEPLPDPDGRIVGRLVRTRWPLAGTLSADGAEVGGYLRLRLALDNTATWDRASEPSRDLAARRAFVGAHLLLAVRDGAFVSLIDPPADAAEAAASCRNSGWWPVLAGPDTVLSAPIILPDQPAIAPESPGDLFDATEIDELLSLRVRTMTEEEKAAARGTDPRAAAIIDRCDALPPEALRRLHGARRDPDPASGPEGRPAGWSERPEPGPTSRTRTSPGSPSEEEWDEWPAGSAEAEEVPGKDPGVPWWDPGADSAVSPGTDSVWVGDVAVARGSRVRLRPTRRADAQDLFLAGQVAVVTAVLSDVDGQTHVAVVLEDDPAADLHEWYGRYWYFAPDELQPLPARVPP